ncbi:hypothetical protein VR7878_03962 [Vibrio ruber DSM 16370]|uniref:Uncharacterized protein n=1 Tax=Vibrio ruber (strain DSM 16370 / JCM 11486 / BCRC 17186 / CECT 7878 / LMG 23124 / VR1) TaxID=1123498 RepID=A0A1R4LU99_VIBR1|nr:hypothetical protein [Vibrio ruber]SJN60058.1 hypothetical protein VR7878_03962 [Vibrio ruber DSM 16370]
MNKVNDTYVEYDSIADNFHAYFMGCSVWFDELQLIDECGIRQLNFIQDKKIIAILNAEGWLNEQLIHELVTKYCETHKEKEENNEYTNPFNQC